MDNSDVCIIIVYAYSGEHDALRTEMSKVKSEYEEYERKDIEFQENKKFFKEQVYRLSAFPTLEV